MYSEFTNRKGSSILKYMEKLGRDSHIYSARKDGLGPLLSQHECYVYATEDELAIALVYKGILSKTTKEDLKSDLALTCELFRNRLLQLTKNIPHIFGVLVMTDSDTAFPLPVNADQELPVAFPLMFLFEAEFSESDIIYASHHFHSKAGLHHESQSHEEIAAELNINLVDFGLK